MRDALFAGAAIGLGLLMIEMTLAGFVLISAQFVAEPPPPDDPFEERTMQLVLPAPSAESTP